MPQTRYHKPRRSVEALRKLLRHAAPRNVVRAIIKMHPADVAELFTALSPIERNRLIDLLFQGHRAGVTLSELPETILEEVLNDVSDERLVAIMARLAVDDQVFLFESLDEERQQNLLLKMTEEDADDLRRFMIYPPDSAGRKATDQYLAFHQDMTVGEVTYQLRNDAEAPEMLSYLYAVDDNNRLVGVVPLRRLLISKEETRLRDVMTTDIIAVGGAEDQEEVARIVARYNILGVPVVDSEGRMLGVVTVDDVIDILEEEFTEDIYHMAGLDDEDRVFSPIRHSLSKRLPWMILNLGTAFVAASVIGLFENVIQEMAVLAIFMPIVAGVSGNTGIQTLTVITRAIAIGELELGSGLKAVGKQVVLGLGIGAIMGLLAGLVAYVWKGTYYLGLILWFSMALNMVVAGFLGSFVPLALKRLGFDPAVGSSVMITASLDTIGYFTFLGLAWWLLPVFA